jgi:hypothetical protein
MQFGGVLDADGGRDASLGMAGVAVVYTALGYEQNTALLFGEQRAVKPCDAAADDYIVVFFNVGLPRCVPVLFGFRLFLGYRHAGKAYQRSGFDAYHYGFFVDTHYLAVYSGPGDDFIAGFQAGGQLRLVMLAFPLRADQKEPEDDHHDGEESPGYQCAAVHDASC